MEAVEAHIIQFLAASRTEIAQRAALRDKLPAEAILKSRI
jgi:hypothetical protein